MTPLKWGDEYLIGVSEIDDQHREFVTIVNKIVWADQNKFPIDIGARLIFELLKYTEFHFVCEENLMYMHKYNGYNNQIAEHKKLLGIMENKMKEFQIGKCDYDSVAKFAFMWLISHIVEEDRKFGEFLKDKRR